MGHVVETVIRIVVDSAVIFALLALFIYGGFYVGTNGFTKWN